MYLHVHILVTHHHLLHYTLILSHFFLSQGVREADTNMKELGEIRLSMWHVCVSAC